MTGRGLVLGIDTSAYTTSVALLTMDGQLVSDRRIVLDVPAGRRGLRQSEAVFQHVNNLPELLESAAADASAWMGSLAQGPAPGHAAAAARTTAAPGPSSAALPLVAVAASVSPRSRPDSYMPVFRAGTGTARALAAGHGIPFVPVSHQDGHIWAGLWSAAPASGSATSEEPPWRRVRDVIVMHASGGTTELLRAVRRRAAGPLEDGGREGAAWARWEVEPLSASEDLYAGQFVDRAGVRLGLPFPAGPHLERLAALGDPEAARLPVAVRGRRLSFSGPDTAAARLTERGVPPADVAAAVQECIAESLARWAFNVLTGQGGPDGVFGEADDGAAAPGLAASGTCFLGVGGVMANLALRQRLTETLSPLDLECLFAAQRFSVDNAVGVALAAAEALAASVHEAG